MIIQVNKKQEEKLEFMAKHGKLKTEDMAAKMIDGFIKRFEDIHGTIDVNAKKRNAPQKPNVVYRMYEFYKEFYFTSLAKEYETDKKKKLIDMKHMKTLRNKIVASIAQELKTEVVAVDDENILAAFKFVLSKIPDWWIKNSFAPSSLASNFEKIMVQIKNPNNAKTNGRGSNKNALDDYLVELTTNSTPGL